MGESALGIAPIPAFLAGRAFRCIRMPFGKRGAYASNSLPHPRCRGKEHARDNSIGLDTLTCNVNQFKPADRHLARLERWPHNQLPIIKNGAQYAGCA